MKKLRIRFGAAFAVAAVMAAALGAAPQDQYTSTKLRKTFPIAPGLQAIFWGLPNDDVRDSFLTVETETRVQFLRFKRMELADPDEWRRRQALIDAAAQRQGLSQPHYLSANLILERGEHVKGQSQLRDGSVRTAINPSIVDNPIELELVLAHEDVHYRQAARGDRPIPLVLSEAKRLQAEANLEVEAYARELRVALERGYASEVQRIRTNLGLFFQQAEVGAADQVFIFGENNKPGRLADLLGYADRSADRESADPDVERVAHKAKFYGFRFVLDDKTGNIGFSFNPHGDDDAAGNGMDHAEIARTMGILTTEFISGFVYVRKLFDADGKEAGREVVIESSEARYLDDATLKSPQSWTKWLRGLAAHPDAHVLRGAILAPRFKRNMLADGRGLTPDWWWRFQGGTQVIERFDAPALVSEEPTAPRTEPFFPKRPVPPARGGPVTGASMTLGEEPPAPPDPDAAPAPPAPEQGAVDVSLEQRMVEFLKDPGQLQRALDARDFSIFKHDVFRAGDAKTRIRTWKKVLNNPAYGGPDGPNDLLARLRHELVVSISEEIAGAEMLKVELIDSGKLNGFRSDLDMTAYLPIESRGITTGAAFIESFKQRFKNLTGGLEPGDIDLTMHDGDFFIPDPRLNAQSFDEYARSLHTVLAELRKEPGRDNRYVDPDANRRQVQRRALRDGRVIVLSPEVERTAASDGSRPAKYRVVRTPKPVSELAWRFGGGWDVNSERFQNIRAGYDPNDQFGNLLENLDHMIRHGDDPPVAAKDFMRAINEGVGSRMINSYSEIHASDMPDDGLSPGLEALESGLDDVSSRLVLAAFQYESGLRLDRDLVHPATFTIDGKVVPTKTVAKLRWIIRTFGLARSAAAYYESAGPGRAPNLKVPPKPTYSSDEIRHVQKLFRLINMAADMEFLRTKGRFNWRDASSNQGRSAWLHPYLERAEIEVRRRPGLDPNVSDDVMGDAIYAEAWRECTIDLRNVVVEAMAVAVKRVVQDISPQGIRRNALQFATADAKANVLAARKLAQQRREQLALFFEMVETLERSTSPQDATPLERAYTDDARALGHQLREKVRHAVNDAAEKSRQPALGEVIENMIGLAGAEFDNVLDDIAPTDADIDKILAAKKGKLDAITDSASAASAAELRKHLRDSLRRRATPADGPKIEAVLNHLDDLLDVVIGLRGEDAKGRPVGGKEGGPGQFAGQFMGELAGNFTGVMVGNSLTNIALAAQTGDELVFREALISEMFNLLLPPAYGVVGTAFMEFGRGRFGQGAISVGTLALFHLVERYGASYGLPGIGQAYLVYNLAKNIPQLAYIVFAQEMADDVVEQALMSRPSREPSGGLALRRADRNPYRFSLAALQEGVTLTPTLPDALTAPLRDAAKTDTPLYPLLYKYAECGDPKHAGWPPNWNPITDRLEALTMAAEDDDAPTRNLVPKARQIFAPRIWKELTSAGLTPADIEASNDSKFTAAFAAYARDRLAHMYAFDLPYYQRMSKIYECFFPKLQERLKLYASPRTTRMPDKRDLEDVLLEDIFLEVVEKWFAAQPDGYKEQWAYASAWQRFWPLHDAQAQQYRFRRGLAMRLVGWYKVYEQAALYKNDGDARLRAEALRNARRLQAEERRALGIRKSLVNKLGASLESMITTNAVRPAPRPAAWLQIPPYFVRFEPETLLPGSKESSAPANAQGQRAAAPQGRPQASCAPVPRAPLPAPESASHAVSDIVANIRADRSRHPLPWQAEYKVTLDSISENWEKLLPGLQLTTAERALLAKPAADGKPENTLLAVKLMASADICDAKGVKFATAPAVPVLGYVIDRIPRFSGILTVHIRATGKDTDGKPALRFVPTKVTVTGPRVPPARSVPGPVTQTVFADLAAGDYQILVTPDHPDFGPGRATARIVNPNADRMTPGAEDVRAAVEVVVNLPYIGRNDAGGPGAGTKPPPTDRVPPELGGDDKKPTDKVPPGLGDDDKKPTDKVPPNLGGGSGTGRGTKNPPNPPDPPPPSEPPPGPDPREVQDGIGEAAGMSQRCEYEASLRAADSLQQRYGSSAAVQAWLAQNLPDLRTNAAKQREARRLIGVGQGLIAGGQLDAAIAALLDARAAAPACMYPPIDGLIGELVDRKIGILVGQEEQAELRCDYASAAGLVSAIAGVQPRRPLAIQWLSGNEARVGQLASHQKEARSLVASAKRIGSGGGSIPGFNARTREERAAVIAQLRRALAVPPPDCDRTEIEGLIGEVTNEDRPTDTLPPGVGDRGTPPKTPTEKLPPGVGGDRPSPPPGPTPPPGPAADGDPVAGTWRIAGQPDPPWKPMNGTLTLKRISAEAGVKLAETRVGRDTIFACGADGTYYEGTIRWDAGGFYDRGFNGWYPEGNVAGAPPSVGRVLVCENPKKGTSLRGRYTDGFNSAGGNLSLGFSALESRGLASPDGGAPSQGLLLTRGGR